RHARSALPALLIGLAGIAGAARAADGDGAAALGRLYADFWEEDLRLHPLDATYAGDPRYNGELPNSLALEYQEQERAFERKYLERARAIGANGLTGQDLLSYEIFTLRREKELEDFEFPRRLLPINQFRNVANEFAQLGSGTGAQPFATVADYDDWL